MINRDFDGLKAAVIEMLAGSSVKVNVKSFQNDTVSFANKDDVLTYLIHLGYLGYHQADQTAFVPNEEIRQELSAAVESTKWNELLAFQRESDNLLDATLNMDCDAVADGIEKIHREYVSAYPALVVELKWNQTASSALQQIRDKQYPVSMKAYTGDILLVGISYDKKAKSMSA